MSTFQSKLPPGILSQGLPQVKEVAPAVTSLEREQIVKEEPKKGKNIYVYSINDKHLFNIRLGLILSLDKFL